MDNQCWTSNGTQERSGEIHIIVAIWIRVMAPELCPIA